ncbi:hypothetical protein BJ878DRAFT_191246 [Calycina marina]|uniref:Uncharacterized protein n=1 Tax=Calycina marina TaxID=1763456 RepID=A0A9P8CI21_9HELO|nr:hypothetical protein BJ878DRAFT_191246 [Calycina marina]
MTSRSVSRNGFLDPDRVERQDLHQEERRSRKATVYDAVAGRLSTAGFIPDHVVYSSTRDTHSSSTVPMGPETILFQAKNAPTRYAESDMYFANEHLRHKLPDSELLKALHSYVSDFYHRSGSNEDSTDWQSMDETALLAFGILLEESSREILGKTGDLVFTEGDGTGLYPRGSTQPPRQSETESRKRNRRE